MKKAWLPAIIFLLLNLPLMAAEHDTTFTETTVVLHTSSGEITGTLTTPIDQSAKMPVVLIIAGSGPTDRNGNLATGTWQLAPGNRPPEPATGNLQLAPGNR